jgi:hypothetical protein
VRGEDFEEVAHTGGKLIVSQNGSVQYQHNNPTPCAVFPLRELFKDMSQTKMEAIHASNHFLWRP